MLKANTSIIIMLVLASICRAEGRLRVVAATGGEVPGMPGAFYRTRILAGLSGPTLHRSGQIAFVANTTQGQALMSDVGGSLLPAVVEKAEGEAGDLFKSMGHAAITDDGRLLFTSSDTVGIDLGRYAYNGPPSALSSFLREGDLISGDSRPISSLPYALQVNGSGVVVFNEGPADIERVNYSRIFYGRPGSFEVLAEDRAPAPGIDGAVFADVPQARLSDTGVVLLTGAVIEGDGPVGSAVWSGLHGRLHLLAHSATRVGVFRANISRAGHVVFTGGCCGTTPQRYGLHIFDPEGELDATIREGHADPGKPGYTISILPTAPSINSIGEVAFRGAFGSSDLGFVGQALYAGTADSLRTIAREGEPAPGIDGATFNRFAHFQINDRGQVAFSAFLDSGVYSPGIWATGLDGGLQFIAGLGSKIEIHGTQHTIARLEAELGHFNDRGELIFLAEFQDGSTALILATVPENSGLLLLMPFIGLLGRWRR